MQSIGTLAGGIAHDFNNILGIILGHTSLLQQIFEEKDESPQSLEAIQQAVKRGAHLVEQILTFARKADIVFTSVNVNEVIKELKNMLSGTFPKTIDFELDLAQNLPPIRADQNQLHQALLNICLNAKDAMSKSGTISIVTGVISESEIQERFPEAKAKDHIEIRIADTGSGMDLDTQKRLFEPFFTTKTRGRGTGLGLAVVYGIVSSHYGFIDVKSELGKGTTFYFYFPMVSEEYVTVQDQTADVMTSGHETILIVEDEQMLIELLENIFQTHGYSVLVARDGKEAIDVYRQHFQKIDLVLTDSGLPKLSGWEAFCSMRKINPQIKTVFASGYFEPDLKTKLIENGVVDFVQKPYSPNEVVNKIREVLDRYTSNA
ncbi:MAG: response regulator [Nitrosopumilaceae archaeon]|nr:response regulator [Nitrosopumilaceae archaeon]NIU86550.1 response regulator [Nitrosopumilaceae archaeon]NIX60750.1 response regulator [Nitrosopumilaceae archaeon]